MFDTRAQTAFGLVHMMTMDFGRASDL